VAQLKPTLFGDESGDVDQADNVFAFAAAFVMTAPP
jgi:hypothetical protein